MSARISAVSAQLPPGFEAFMRTDGVSGAVTLSGGVGNGLRQIVLNVDGSSIIRAFDAGNNAWSIVKEIRP